jgi:type IV pilus assembly protein PilM
MATTIGLDIGSSAVRAAQLSFGSRGVGLTRLGQVQLPEGAVRDGEVVDSGVVTEAIRTLWSRFGFKGRNVVLGVANQQVVVRQVDLPYLPDDEMRESLRFQAQDYIPIPIEQAILDFHTLDTYETEESQRFSRLLLVAAQKDMINALVEPVRAAKLEPAMVDLNAFAVLRSLAPPASAAGDHDGELLLDIGAGVTNILVHEGGVPRFVRILLMGGNTVTDALVSALGLTFEEAENAKAESGPTGRETSGSDDVAGVITERGGWLIEEIRGSVDYYSAQLDSIPIKRVVLSGGGGELPGLRDRLSDALRVPVDRGHPLQDLAVDKSGLSQDELIEAEPHIAVAVGLALGTVE